MLNISALTKSFRSGTDTVHAVDDVSLEVARGELLVLLGPSGCGKTTLLRCIAGLESAGSGTIAFGDRTVYDSSRSLDVPPNKRNIGMVFQSYALWPHKTVRANIAYPLKVRRLKRESAGGRWVEEAAELVDCGHLLDRYPGQLSGGQQQRVALARGLVARPDLMLFDEPLSNLDALLRNQVRGELHALHERIGFTGVYVTHDQTEALALGDRLAIMRSGRVEQIGTPTEVYEHPDSEYAAHFVGFANRIELQRTSDGWTTGGGTVVDVDLPVPRTVDAVHVRFRPEVGRISTAEAAPTGALAFPARFVDAVYAGAHDEVTVLCGDAPVMVRGASSGTTHAVDDRLVVHVPRDRARFFAAATGEAITAEPVATPG